MNNDIPTVISLTAAVAWKALLPALIAAVPLTVIAFLIVETIHTSPTQNRRRFSLKRLLKIKP